LSHKSFPGKFGQTILYNPKKIGCSYTYDLDSITVSGKTKMEHDKKLENFLRVATNGKLTFTNENARILQRAFSCSHTELVRALTQTEDSRQSETFARNITSESQRRAA